MITIEKLKVYEKSNGLHDSIYGGKRSKYSILEEGEYFKIRDILQEVRLVNRGLASDDYSNTVKQKLIEQCDSQEAIDYLNYLAHNTRIQ